MSDGYYGAGREQRTQVIKSCKELVIEHYKEPVNGLFDDMVASVLKALLFNESESDAKVDIGHLLFESVVDVFFLIYWFLAMNFNIDQALNLTKLGNWLKIAKLSTL